MNVMAEIVRKSKGIPAGQGLNIFNLLFIIWLRITPRQAWGLNEAENDTIKFF